MTLKLRDVHIESCGTGIHSEGGDIDAERLSFKDCGTDIVAKGGRLNVRDSDFSEGAAPNRAARRAAKSKSRVGWSANYRLPWLKKD